MGREGKREKGVGEILGEGRIMVVMEKSELKEVACGRWLSAKRACGCC